MQKASMVGEESAKTIFRGVQWRGCLLTELRASSWGQSLMPVSFYHWPACGLSRGWKRPLANPHHSNATWSMPNLFVRGPSGFEFCQGVSSCHAIGGAAARARKNLEKLSAR